MKNKLITQRDADAKERRITQMTNFCRVFEIPSPEEFPEGYCFGGGKPVIFTMVDWFNPIVLSADGPETWEQAKAKLPDFIRPKRYFIPGRRYLVLTDFNESLLID